MAQTGKLILTLALLLYLTARTLSALPQQERGETMDPSMMEDETSTIEDPITSMDAIPSSDFTLFNFSSTIEEVLAEANIPIQTGSQILTNPRSKRRPCACSTTIGAYGGRQGTVFVDIATNACDVEITDIWVRHGSIVDAIQVRYNFSNGLQQSKPLRGGNGGELSHIHIPRGGKLIGLFGGITNFTGYNYYKTVITQLRLLVLDAEANLQIYGPFGSQFYLSPSTFAVYGGQIMSIFGYHGRFLHGIGVYYKPWGACSTTCV